MDPFLLATCILYYHDLTGRKELAMPLHPSRINDMLLSSLSSISSIRQNLISWYLESLEYHLLFLFHILFVVYPIYDRNNSAKAERNEKTEHKGKLKDSKNRWMRCMPAKGYCK